MGLSDEELEETRAKLTADDVFAIVGMIDAAVIALRNAKADINEQIVALARRQSALIAKQSSKGKSQ
jgi:hypothetical protein